MPETLGIPRALLYHRYGKFWESYFAGLGLEIVVSKPTNAQTVERGCDKVSSEVCLPIKIMAGHIAELKDSVDYLFVPRLVWDDEHLYACPKMIGIPDLVRLMVPSSCRVLAPMIKGNFVASHLGTGLRLSKNPARVLHAYRAAAPVLKRKTEYPVFPERKTKIALISHFYNLGDAFVAKDIVDALSAAGIVIYTKEDLPETALRSRESGAGRIRWLYERELYNAFKYYLDKVDGICTVISFGCGPDSLVVEMMRQESESSSVPFTQIVVDEHTGRAGIKTRLEAFVDTIRRTRGRTVRS